MTTKASALIGKRIIIARENAGLNKKELAKLINVAPSTISRYEKGDFDRVKIAILKSIADATNVNPLWISGESENMEKPPQEQAYYYNKKSAQAAQRLFDNPDLQALLDAADGVDSEGIRLAAELLTRFKKTNPDG